MGFSHQLTLRVPFENERQSQIAKNSLSPDPIIRINELKVSYECDENTLVCKFSGVSDRVIRVAISTVIENLKAIIECIDDFDGKEDIIFDDL
ncbi:uncharacterized protein PRCAT00006363001 [Priceomyces carsonii]|uniref:uncharacterized protein n=1 Tax=Priceomyces carsonii TaxID=28549 RepID=UPI002ED9636F|nr:unnamed protein product [Priceomyces carsonii]